MKGATLYDVRGRVAHESIFNMNNGNYRCPSTQQGYSPFSTWTRALAWIMCGYAEELEYLQTLSEQELDPLGGREKVEDMMRRAAGRPATTTSSKRRRTAFPIGIPPRRNC